MNSIPKPTLFDQALQAAMPTAHGIKVTGPCKVGGKHLSEAPNEPRRSGSMPTMLQDDNRKLSKWLASQLGARRLAEEAAEDIAEIRRPVSQHPVIQQGEEDARAELRHSIIRQRDGYGPGACVQVVCSCGFRGPFRYEWQDDMCAGLRADAAAHMAAPGVK